MTDEPWHGTRTGYTHHGCRCPLCTRANADHQREYMRRRVAEGYKTPRRLGTEPPQHGTRNAYAYYGCRCPACAGANAAYLRERYRKVGRRRAASS